MHSIHKSLVVLCMLCMTFAENVPAYEGSSENNDIDSNQHDSQISTGQLCIAKINLKDYSPRSRRAQTFEARTKLRLSFEKGVDVSVDGSNPVHASPAEGGQLTLPVAGKHLLTIRRENGQLLEQSFHFSFSAKKSRQLCLWYRAAIYDNWQIDDLQFSQRHDRCMHCVLK
jgi:hypothetical protein